MLHGHYLTADDRAAMIEAVQRDITALPGTRFEPYVPDFQPIDWSVDRPDPTPDDVDAFARQMEELRNLPEVRCR